MVSGGGQATPSSRGIVGRGWRAGIREGRVDITTGIALRGCRGLAGAPHRPPLPQTSALGSRDALPAGGGQGSPPRCAYFYRGATCRLCTWRGPEPVLQSRERKGLGCRESHPGWPQGSGFCGAGGGCSSVLSALYEGWGRSEETLRVGGTRSGVRFPCPVWALGLVAHWGAGSMGSAGRWCWRWSCGDKGFRDVALPGEAAPEPAVLSRSSGSSPAFPNFAVRVVMCRGQGPGTPSGPAPKPGAGMTKYGVRAGEQAGRNPVIL